MSQGAEVWMHHLAVLQVILRLVAPQHAFQMQDLREEGRRASLQNQQ